MTMSLSSVPCPVCSAPIDSRPAKGRKSGKPSIMMVCPANGRHFRGFITDREYVASVFARVEAWKGRGLSP